MAKKDNNYFKMFMDIAADAITAATQLKETINNYDPEKIHEQMLAMHEVEHAADNKKTSDDGKTDCGVHHTHRTRRYHHAVVGAGRCAGLYGRNLSDIIHAQREKYARRSSCFGELIYQSTVALKLALMNLNTSNVQRYCLNVSLK